MDTDSFIYHVKTEDIHKDIAEDVETRFDTSNNEIDRLNLTHYFVMKIPNKRELKQIAFNHSSDIDFQDFLNIYKKSTAKSYSFFWLLILLLHQKNLNVPERIF